MRKLRPSVYLAIVLMFGLLAATAAVAEVTDLAIDPSAWDQAGLEVENPTFLAGTYEVALNDYCDTSSTYGTTASCETNLVVPAGTCPNGISSKGCRTVGNTCTAGGGTGKWCKRCYVKCKSSTCVEGEPIDGTEGNGDVICDDDAVPVEP